MPLFGRSNAPAQQPEDPWEWLGQELERRSHPTYRAKQALKNLVERVKGRPGQTEDLRWLEQELAGQNKLSAKAKRALRSMMSCFRSSDGAGSSGAASVHSHGSGFDFRSLTQQQRRQGGAGGRFGRGRDHGQARG